MKIATIETETVISIFKKALKEYKKKVEEQPTSTFYIGLVRNTKEYIKDIEASYYSSIKEVKEAVASAAEIEKQ